MGSGVVYIKGKWYEECEMQALVKQLEEERDAYKAELIGFLRKACDCIMGSDADCSLCPFYFVVSDKGCPSNVSTYAAKLRLEELMK